MYLLPSQKSITKSNSFYEAVISGDSLILRRPANVQGQPPKERCVNCVKITFLLLKQKKKKFQCPSSCRLDSSSSGYIDKRG